MWPVENPPYRQDPKQISEYALQLWIEQAWHRVGNGKYYIWVGAINWAQFDFAANGAAVSIIMSDQNFMEDLNEATIEFELAAQMPAPARGRVAGGIDPAISALMKEHARRVFAELVWESKYPDTNDKLVTKFVKGTDRIIDWSDGPNKLQGIVAQLRVGFN
jgi:hypothetical protein